MANRKKKILTDADIAKMRDIETYEHSDKKRTNNPPVGMAQHDKTSEVIKTYQFVGLYSSRTNGTGFTCI